MFVFLPHLQVHRYLPSHEGSDGVHGVPGQTDHRRGLDLHLCLLHAVVLPGGHPGWILHPFSLNMSDTRVLQIIAGSSQPERFQMFKKIKGQQLNSSN